MSLKVAQAATLLAATITTGLMAGVFGLYAHTIMRGLHTTDDRTFVDGVPSDRPGHHQPAVHADLLRRAGRQRHRCGALPARDTDRCCRGSSLRSSLYLVAVVITLAVHVPLNDHIKAAGDPGRIANLAVVRENFHETRWIAWNIVRALATTVAFGCLAWALVLDGRTTGPTGARSPLPVLTAGVPVPGSSIASPPPWRAVVVTIAGGDAALSIGVGALT